jgi:DNA-binding NarL/FixJ family response regulator
MSVTSELMSGDGTMVLELGENLREATPDPRRYIRQFVIDVSANSDSATQREAMAAGMGAFLPKLV